MRSLRCLVPSAAALVAVLFAVQAKDVVACANETEGVQHAGETPADAAVQGGHPRPVPSGSHDRSDRVRLAPEPFDFAAVVAIPEVERRGVNYVPLG